MGGFIAYLIQFKFKFFGASLVTIKDIIGVWATYIIVVGVGVFFISSMIAEKIQKSRIYRKLTTPSVPKDIKKLWDSENL